MQAPQGAWALLILCFYDQIPRCSDKALAFPDSAKACLSFPDYYYDGSVEL